MRYINSRFTYLLTYLHIAAYRCLPSECRRIRHVAVLRELLSVYLLTCLLLYLIDTSIRAMYSHQAHYGVALMRYDKCFMRCDETRRRAP